MYRSQGKLAAMLVLGWVLVSGCATTSSAPVPPFDVQQVTLYDCGLAQVERLARVEGAVELSIHLGLAHLDDMLATLMVATDGGVRVTGVQFPSVLSMGQARASSSFAYRMGDESATGNGAGDVARYVRALVGTPVEVTARDDARLVGTVLDCACGLQAAAGKDQPPPPDRLVLVSESGDLQWVALESVASIRPLSEREGESIRRFARQLGSATGLEETAVRIRTSSDSSGLVSADYVRQAPVWRMLYKVVANAEQVQLEAWAMAHNDTDEDWKDVHLTLVSGLPRSYVTSVASPRYAERAALYTDGALNMYPQLGAATPDSLLYEEVSPGYGYVQAGSAGYGAGGMAFGSSSSVSRSVGTAGVATVSESESSLLAVGQPAAEEATEPRVEDEISTYRALETVSIPGRSSSMVPLVRRQLPGQGFTAIDQLNREPGTCVRFENTTGLVLQYGASSVYTNGRFRGQTELSRTQPGEVRMVCYGEDRDVSYSVHSRSERTAKLLEWSQSRLWVHALEHTWHTYEVENLAGLERRIAIQINHRRNGRVLTPDKTLAGENREKLHLFSLPGQETREVVVELEEGIRYNAALNTPALERITEHEAIPAAQIAVVRQALNLSRQVDEKAAALAKLAEQLQMLQTAVNRKKGNLAAVPAGASGSRTAERMLADLMETERAQESMLAQQKRLTAERDALTERLREVLSGMPAAGRRPMAQ